jgi:hypothetical protein
VLCGNVFSEVHKFEALNGFINIYLLNEQFMDRVHVTIQKKNVTYKSGGFTGSTDYGRKHELENSHSPAFVVSEIIYLISNNITKLVGQ